MSSTEVTLTVRFQHLQSFVPDLVLIFGRVKQLENGFEGIKLMSYEEVKSVIDSALNQKYEGEGLCASFILKEESHGETVDSDQALKDLFLTVVKEGRSEFELFAVADEPHLPSHTRNKSETDWEVLDGISQFSVPAPLKGTVHNIDVHQVSALKTDHPLEKTKLASRTTHYKTTPDKAMFSEIALASEFSPKNTDSNAFELLSEITISSQRSHNVRSERSLSFVSVASKASVEKCVEGNDSQIASVAEEASVTANDQVFIQTKQAAIGKTPTADTLFAPAAGTDRPAEDTSMNTVFSETLKDPYLSVISNTKSEFAHSELYQTERFSSIHQDDNQSLKTCSNIELKPLPVFEVIADCISDRTTKCTSFAGVDISDISFLLPEIGKLAARELTCINSAGGSNSQPMEAPSPTNLVSDTNNTDCFLSQVNGMKNSIISGSPVAGIKQPCPEGGKFDILLSKISVLVAEILKEHESVQGNCQAFEFLKSCCDDESEFNLLEKMNIPEDEDEKVFISVFNSVFSNEEVVKNFQCFISSPEVNQFVVDICRNDVNTLLDFKPIFSSHFGYLLPEFGKFLQNSPQALILLPHWCRWLKKLFCHKSLLRNDKSCQANGSGLPIPHQLHENIMCDGCMLDTNYKQQSLNNLNNLNNFICGVRYKSAVKDDFDLCETCEQSGLFDKEYGPFLKIKVPEQAPKELFCVFKAVSLNSEVTLKTEPASSLDANVTSDIRYANLVNCEANNAVESSRMQNISGGSDVHESTPIPSVYGDNVQSNASENVLRCPRNSLHILRQFTVPNRLFACDVCDKRPQRLGSMFGCRICDWDICIKCAKDNFKQFDFVNTKKIVDARKSANPVSRFESVTKRFGIDASGVKKTPNQKTMNATGSYVCPETSVPETVYKVNAKNEPFKMKFIKDESAFDGCVMYPGQRFKKGWRVENSSDYLTWPTLTTVVCVSEDSLGAPPEGFLVCSLPPKTVGTVWIDLVAPKVPGRYTSFWRLVAPPNDAVSSTQPPILKKFGDRLWVDILVVEPNFIPKNSAETAKEMGLKSWFQELKQLSEIGFRNEAQNIYLLEKLKGDVARVVDKLLKRENKN